MCADLVKKSSGDVAGNYYIAPGKDAGEWASNLKAVKAPPELGYTQYNCPWDHTKGPFVVNGLQTSLGPIASNRPWTPFAAMNTRRPGALPLPLTISTDDDGFKFSVPPAFTYKGHTYWPTLPEKTVQPAPQYYGNEQNDFRVAPATKNGDNYVPAKFELPTDEKVPYTKLEGFSDWAATVSMSSKAGQSIAVTFATGSPLAFVTFDSKTDYGCLSLSKLDTVNPVRSWFPKDYRCYTPAGVAIRVAGADKVTEQAPALYQVEIQVGGRSVKGQYQARQNEPKESIATGLARQFQYNALLNAGDVTKMPDNNFSFLISAKDNNTIIKQADAKVSPGGEKSIILVAAEQPATPVSPPATASVIGISIAYKYFPSDDLSVWETYRANYALIAPTGGRWLFDSQGHLVCDFTKATSESRTLIVCGMPKLYDSAYDYYGKDLYDDPGVGAADFLRRFWQEMQPYAYGCPRHLTNGKDDGTGTRFGPNDKDNPNLFTPQVTTKDGRTTVTTQFYFNLSYPAGQPPGTGGTLFCLFPHQWRDYASNTATIFGKGQPLQPTYATSAGPLYLSGGGKDPKTPAFTTTYTFPGILAHLPNVAGLKGTESFDVYDYPNTKAHQTVKMTLAGQMQQDAWTPTWGADFSKNGNPRAFIPINPSPMQKFCLGSYDWGKLVGLMGDIIPSAKDLKQTNAMTAAIRQLNAQLGQWLSSGLLYANANTPFPAGVEAWQKGQLHLQAFAGDKGLLNNQQFLYYDQQWSTLIAYPSGYFADTNINDHHFHYGYWLRAAAQLALGQARGDDPDNKAGTFINNYGATVNLIIKDIANPLRGDTGAIGASAKAFPAGPAMPFMRYMDGYSGHSWASGLTVNIIDQESVSEAMSAWTGVILWGEVTNNQRLRDLGIWMYVHEMVSFYEYWMDCAQGRSAGSVYFPNGSEPTVVGEQYNEAIKGGLDSGYVRFFSHVFNAYRQLVTYFGREPIFFTGIQWLPFHGGSLYLSTNDAAVQWTLGWTWKWCYANSKFLWDNYNAKNPRKPLVTLSKGVDAFVVELNASVNDADKTKHVTEGLRNQFMAIGYKLATLDDEQKTGQRVICKRNGNNQWLVTDFGEKFYTLEVQGQTLNVYGAVGEYRPTLFARTWEQIAWQGLATIDPNCDQVFWDNFHVSSADQVWGELEKAVGSAGDKDIAGKGWTPLLGQAVSSSYYWIYNMNGAGVRDARVSADYPFAVKFLGKGWPERNRRPRYIVWNMTDKPKTVTFSDGFKMENVPAYQWATKAL